jgi:hypothetical protein
MASMGHTTSFEQSGLVIDVSTPCLAYSPDGIVTIDGEQGLIEIKCPRQQQRKD